MYTPPPDGQLAHASLKAQPADIFLTITVQLSPADHARLHRLHERYTREWNTPNLSLEQYLAVCVPGWLELEAEMERRRNEPND